MTVHFSWSELRLTSNERGCILVRVSGKPGRGSRRLGAQNGRGLLLWGKRPDGSVCGAGSAYG